MSANEYFAKTERALAAARRAIEDEDSETAANRLYYAMFAAARAALIHIGEIKAAAGKHGTVIGQFGLHLVQKGVVATELGRALNEAQELRTEGDYEPRVPAMEDVLEYVAPANQLVEVVRTLLKKPKPGSNPS